LNFDHPPLRQYDIDRVDTQINPKHGWYVWTDPGDEAWGVARLLLPLLRRANDPILDEGPCSICNLSDVGSEVWNPACDTTAVNLPEIVSDDEPGVSPLEYNHGDPYLRASVVKRFMRLYVEACVDGNGPCPIALDSFVDALACGVEK